MRHLGSSLPLERLDLDLRRFAPGAKVSDDLASLPKSVGLLTKPYRKEKLAAMVREALETR